MEGRRSVDSDKQWAADIWDHYRPNVRSSVCERFFNFAPYYTELLYTCVYVPCNSYVAPCAVSAIFRYLITTHQGYAKLVGFDLSIGIEFEFSISKLGFDIDSGLAEVLVLVSVLTQTGIKYWFWFRVGFDFDPGLVGYHGRNQTGHKGTMGTISFFSHIGLYSETQNSYFSF